MRRSGAFLVLSALVGAVFGWFMQSLPAPSDPGAFWVGNLAAPWGILAFCAGWAQRSWRWAAVGGLAAEVATVAGFYSYILTGAIFDPWMHYSRFAYPGLQSVIQAGFADWLRAVSLWAMPALLAGTLLGLAGRWWGPSRSMVAGVVLALPFFLEPLWWRYYDGYFSGPLAVWIVEIGVGIALLGLVVVAARRQGPRLASG